MKIKEVKIGEVSIFPVGGKLHMGRDLVCLCHSALCQAPRTV